MPDLSFLIGFLAFNIILFFQSTQLPRMTFGLAFHTGTACFKTLMFCTTYFSIKWRLTGCLFHKETIRICVNMRQCYVTSCSDRSAVALSRIANEFLKHG